MRKFTEIVFEIRGFEDHALFEAFVIDELRYSNKTSYILVKFRS